MSINILIQKNKTLDNENIIVKNSESSIKWINFNEKNKNLNEVQNFYLIDNFINKDIFKSEDNEIKNFEEKVKITEVDLFNERLNKNKINMKKVDQSYIGKKIKILDFNDYSIFNNSDENTLNENKLKILFPYKQLKEIKESLRENNNSLDKSIENILIQERLISIKNDKHNRTKNYCSCCLLQNESVMNQEALSLIKNTSKVINFYLLSNRLNSIDMLKFNQLLNPLLKNSTDMNKDFREKYSKLNYKLRLIDKSIDILNFNLNKCQIKKITLKNRPSPLEV